MANSSIIERIYNKKMLAVEGADDVAFFVRLLKKMNIHGVYVAGLGGKDNFNKDLSDLHKRHGFSDITHFAVIRDKETDEAFESVVNIFQRKMGFRNIPAKNGLFASGVPRIGIFIMPGNTIEGTMLEDLCLKSVEGHPAMKCVNEFATCISALKTTPKNISKAKAQVFKAQTFLATQPETVGTVGLGAQKSYWDFDSPCLDELKSFLDNMR